MVEDASIGVCGAEPIYAIPVEVAPVADALNRICAQLSVCEFGYANTGGARVLAPVAGQTVPVTRTIRTAAVGTRVALIRRADDLIGVVGAPVILEGARSAGLRAEVDSNGAVAVDPVGTPTTHGTACFIIHTVRTATLLASSDSAVALGRARGEVTAGIATNVATTEIVVTPSGDT